MQINLLSKKDECFIYSDFKKIFIYKKKKNKNLEKFEEIIKILDQDKMKKAYNYLIAIIKDN